MGFALVSLGLLGKHILKLVLMILILIYKSLYELPENSDDK